jgi:hypothetical protein
VTALAVRSELTRLADKAVDHSGGHTVAVVRGFDRTSRHRAAELRRKLQRRGVTAIDLTPLVLTLRHSDRHAATMFLDDSTIGLVVDAGPGSSHAPNLAAELGVPLLHSSAAAGPVRDSVVGVFIADKLTAVALDRVEFRPLDAQQCQLNMQSDTSQPAHAAGAMTVHLEHPEVGRADRLVLQPGEQALAADAELTVWPHWGPYTLVVDDRPVAPLTDPVTLRCLVDRLEHLRP